MMRARDAVSDRQCDGFRRNRRSILLRHGLQCHPDGIRQMMLAHSSIQFPHLARTDRKLACDRSAKIEYTEAVFFLTICLCRVAQRKGRVRKLSPDRQVFIRNCKPAKPKHVAARLRNAANLRPSNLVDFASSKAWPALAAPLVLNSVSDLGRLRRCCLLERHGLLLRRTSD